jgi:hypothetical protein
LLLDDGLINSIPIDPQRATEVTMAGGSSQSGNFLFIPMKKNDVKDR